MIPFRIPGMSYHAARVTAHAGDLASNLDRLHSFSDIVKPDQIGEKFDDIAVKIEHVSRVSKKWGEALGQNAAHARKVRDELEKTKKLLDEKLDDLKDEEKELARLLASHTATTKEIREQEKLVKQLKKATTELVEEQEKLEKSMRELPLQMGQLARITGGLALGAFDKLGKAVTSVGISGFTAGIYQLETAIQSVYELHERWTKLLGAFNLGVGATSQGLSRWAESAKGMEGKWRDLTGEFGTSHKDFEAFIKQFGFMDPQLVQFGIDAVKAGRALGIGADGAGQLAKQVYLMGGSADRAYGSLRDIAAGADKAGVSAASFGAEIVQSKEFMAEFGLTGRKAFVETASFARHLGLSLKSLEGFTKTTDTFESAIETASRLNTIFGTSINAMDVMLEEDPAKRLEMIRQQLKEQGITYENMTRRERMFLADNLKMSAEELAGVMTTSKTYERFFRDQEKQQKTRTDNETYFQEKLGKTRETLFAMSLGWDMITGSVEQLIKPFTQLLGLTEKMVDGKRINDSFGTVMATLFGKFSAFIDKVSKNTAWGDFVDHMAREFKDLAEYLDKLSTDPEMLNKWITKASTAADQFYEAMKDIAEVVKFIGSGIAKWGLEGVLDNVKSIVLAWVGMKAIMGSRGLVMAGESAINLAGEGSAVAARGRQMPLSGKGGMRGLGMIGGGLAGALSGETMLGKTAGIAGGIASAFIPFIGPLIAPFGGMLAAKGGDMLDRYLFPEKGEITREEVEKRRAHERLITRTSAASSAFDAITQSVENATHAQDRHTTSLQKNIDKANKARESRHNKELEGLGIERQRAEMTIVKDDAETAALNKIQEHLDEESKSHTTYDPANSAADIKELVKRFGYKEEDFATGSRGNRYMKEGPQGGLNPFQVLSGKVNDRKYDIEKDIEKQKRASQDFYDKITSAGTEFTKVTTRSKFALEYSTTNAYRSYVAKHPGQSVMIRDAMVAEFGEDLVSSFEDQAGRIEFAEGGIVTKPTRALIGEAGPEAVIPLKAMVGSFSQTARRFGLTSSRGPANYAAGSSGRPAPSTVKVVAGDIYLDGTKVGRHLARALLAE